MELKIIEEDFVICQVKDLSQLDLSLPFLFIAKTDQELSLVLPSKAVPKNATEKDFGWKALRIEGILDFSLVGILAELSSLLAQQKISIFCISTYNTDYILIKETAFTKAQAVLTTAGYQVLD